MRWMGWKKDATQQARGGAEHSPRGMGTPSICAALEERGVTPELCRPLSLQLEARLATLDATTCHAMLDGVALAVALQQETHQQLARSLKGLKEVERMMGAFSGELSKLDEVLEVLAAYVRRMRTSGSRDEDRVLH